MCDIDEELKERFRDWVENHIMSLNACELICMPSYEQHIRRIRSEARDLSNRVSTEANPFEISLWADRGVSWFERESVVNRIIARVRV